MCIPANDETIFQSEKVALLRSEMAAQKAFASCELFLWSRDIRGGYDYDYNR